MSQDSRRRRTLPEAPIKARPEIAAHTDVIRTLIAPGVERLPELRGVASDQLFPDPEQPRKVFEEEPLRELAEDMRRNGTIQPLVVRPREEGGYWIVVGERRWRAAQMAGQPTLPCLVRPDISPPQVRRMQLRENLQREDLNALERAQALMAIREQEGLTWEQVANEFGYSVRRIHQLVGLTRLPESAQALLRSNAISAGHAVVLESLPPDQQAALAAEAARERWSVEQLREAARREPPAPESPAPDGGSGGETDALDRAPGSPPPNPGERPAVPTAPAHVATQQGEPSSPSHGPPAATPSQPASGRARRAPLSKELRVQLSEPQHAALHALAQRLHTHPSGLTRLLLEWALAQAAAEGPLPWE